MITADIIDVDTTEFEEGNVVYKGGQPLTPEEGDQEPVRGDAFQCLGLVAACAPANDAGHAEMLKLSGVGGLDDAIVGGRDVRVFTKLGVIDQGDTLLLSTDPETDVQVRCHGERRQLVMFARKDSPTSEMGMLMIDGKEETFHVQCFGGTLKFSKKDGWIMRDGSGAGFHLNNGVMNFNCGGNLTGNPAAQPLRSGPAPQGGIPVPGWFGMVRHILAWLRWWVWQRLPRLPEAERETA